MIKPALEHDPRTGFVTGVERCISPNQDERPDGVTVDVLVIHAISLPPDTFGGPHITQLFTNSLNPDEHPCFKEISGLRVSAHFLIERSGRVMQFVSTRNRAWHAGVSSFRGRAHVNDFSLGIELEGCDSKPFMAEQYDALIGLTHCLMGAYPSIIAENIVGHSGISPGRKTDPGPCFNWSEYLGRIT